jgi:hypothetical protein
MISAANEPPYSLRVVARACEPGPFCFWVQGPLKKRALHQRGGRAKPPARSRGKAASQEPSRGAGRPDEHRTARADRRRHGSPGARAATDERRARPDSRGASLPSSRADDEQPAQALHSGHERRRASRQRPGQTRRGREHDGTGPGQPHSLIHPPSAPDGHRRARPQQGQHGADRRHSSRTGARP